MYCIALHCIVLYYCFTVSSTEGLMQRVLLPYIFLLNYYLLLLLYLQERRKDSACKSPDPKITYYTYSIFWI